MPRGLQKTELREPSRLKSKPRLRSQLKSKSPGMLKPKPERTPRNGWRSPRLKIQRLMQKSLKSRPVLKINFADKE